MWKAYRNSAVAVKPITFRTVKPVAGSGLVLNEAYDVAGRRIRAVKTNGIVLMRDTRTNALVKRVITR